MIIKPTKQDLAQAEKIMTHLEKQYQEKHPCPVCHSRNVHIEINAMGGGYVYGSEWCDDCGWKEVTDTFPKRSC
jgi:hypothetical protein